MDAKYRITLTSAGWEIFENDVTWGVSYPTMGEAWSALHLIVALEKKTLTF